VGLPYTKAKWRGFDGSAWRVINTAGAAGGSREYACAAFLTSCGGTGGIGAAPCILLAGGRTPGVSMATTGFSVVRVDGLNTATPTMTALAPDSGAYGAPTPRHSMACAATPDGAAAVFFGGQDQGGAVFNDMLTAHARLVWRVRGDRGAVANDQPHGR